MSNYVDNVKKNVVGQGILHELGTEDAREKYNMDSLSYSLPSQDHGNIDNTGKIQSPRFQEHTKTFGNPGQAPKNIVIRETNSKTHDLNSTGWSKEKKPPQDFNSAGWFSTKTPTIDPHSANLF